MLKTNKRITLNAMVTIKNGEVDVPVANFNASISENKLDYNINVAIMNEQLINASEENKTEFQADKQAFETEVKSYLSI